jgi:hypothetical protein
MTEKSHARLVLGIWRNVMNKKKITLTTGAGVGLLIFLGLVGNLKIAREENIRMKMDNLKLLSNMLDVVEMLPDPDQLPEAVKTDLNFRLMAFAEERRAILGETN